MATFTHTIVWTINIEGSSTTYTFSYDVEDVDDVERFTTGRQAELNCTFRAEPVLSAALANIGPSLVKVVESAGPTSLPEWNVDEGDLVLFHLSDAGGTWNSSGSAATTTLRSNDQLVAGRTNPLSGFDVIALHQPAS